MCIQGDSITLNQSNQKNIMDEFDFLIVSSTSWTEDEDFGILLDALVLYDSHAKEQRNQGSRILCIITGKGPLKEFYLTKIHSLNLKNVVIKTAWLTPLEYPLLLGSADLGICLHTSSSGLDLPMKIVDMFGVGLPVLAFYYPTLEELVQKDINGVFFTDSIQLCNELEVCFIHFRVYR